MQDYRSVAKIASRIELPPRAVKVGADVWDIVVPSAGLGLTALILSRLLGHSQRTSALLTVLGALAGAGLGASGAVSIKDLLGKSKAKAPTLAGGPAGEAEEIPPEVEQLAKALMEESESGGGGGPLWTAIKGITGAAGTVAGYKGGAKAFGPLFRPDDIDNLRKEVGDVASLINSLRNNFKGKDAKTIDSIIESISSAEKSLGAAHEASSRAVSLATTAKSFRESLKAVPSEKSLKPLREPLRELVPSAVRVNQELTSAEKTLAEAAQKLRSVSARGGVKERLGAAADEIERQLANIGRLRGRAGLRIVGRAGGGVVGGVGAPVLLDWLFGPRKE